MKKIAITLFFLLYMCVPASAAIFVEIESTPSVLIYVDVDSIEKRVDYGKEYLVAWIQYVPVDKKEIGHVLHLYAFNRKAKQMQILSEYVYDKTGNNTSSQTWSFLTAAYKEIAPGSSDEIAYNFVMKYKK